MPWAYRLKGVAGPFRKDLLTCSQIHKSRSFLECWSGACSVSPSLKLKIYIYIHILTYKRIFTRSQLPSPLCSLVGPVQSTWNLLSCYPVLGGFICGGNGLCQRTALKTCGPFAVLQSDGAALQVYKFQLFPSKSIFFLPAFTSMYTKNTCISK